MICALMAVTTHIHTHTHTAVHGSLRCSAQREFHCSASATSLRTGVRMSLSDVDTEGPTGNFQRRTGLKYEETAAVDGGKLSAALITATQWQLMNNNHMKTRAAAKLGF